MVMAKEFVLGVDIGGTKVAAGVVDAMGHILSKARVPMHASGTDLEGMECVHQAIRSVLLANRESAVSAIGVACPGPLDMRTGAVIQSPNLPCWRNFPLAKHVRDAYGVPTRVDNDANAAGLAEALWGAGLGYNSVFYATLGTGIGTAIVLDRQLYYGRTGEAAEGGHMTIDIHAPCRCGCGKRGCLESMASGPAIARRMKEAIAAGRPSCLAAHAVIIGARDVEQAWRQGDPLATEILQETADLLSVWLGNTIDLLEPDVIIVGGGMGTLVSRWFDHIRRQLPHWTINSRAQEIPLLLASYGPDAGIAGAAALCFSDAPLLAAQAAGK